MVLPLAAIAAGGSFAQGLMGLFGANKQAKAARNASATAQLQDAQQQEMMQGLIDQIMGQAGNINSNAAFNDAEGSQMMQGFMQSLMGQQGYIDQTNQRNAGNDQLSMELRDYLRGIDDRNYQDTGVVRQGLQDRQVQADAAARDQRNYELREIAQNKQLKASERAYAERQLSYERQMAQQEVDREGREIGDYQRGLSNEYNERYQRLTADRAQAMSERQREQDRQDDILNRTQYMRDELTRVLQGQGSLADPELYGQSDVDSESARRNKVYSAQLDKLSDRAISMNEADLIRRGVDGGGSANSNEMRAELMARLGPAYQEAMLKADTEAQGLVEGKNKLLMDKYGQQMSARDRLIAETRMRTSEGLEAELGLNPLQSGIYSADIGSGMDYVNRQSSQTGVRGAVDIESALYDQMSNASPLSEYLGIGSRQTQGSNVSGINTDYIDPKYIDPSMFAEMLNASRNRSTQGYSSGGQIMSAAMNGMSDARKYSNQNSIAAQTAAGTANSRLNSAWGDLFGAGISALSGFATPGVKTAATGGGIYGPRM